jgi:glycosyltransferase involved in cell wall biosynthesis
MKNARRQCVVIFLSRQVRTGGEKYLMEINLYLKIHGFSVEPIYIESFNKGQHGIGLILDCLLSNIRAFLQVRKLGNLSKIIFFEDFHYHPRLLLFNFLIYFISRRLRMLVLVQSTLFYHSTLQKKWLKRLDEWTVRVFFRQSDLILTNSEFTRQQVLLLGIDPNLVKVTYCGYDGNLRAKSAEVRINKKNNRSKRILFVGQCSYVKGIEFLIRAVPLLTDKKILIDVVGNTASEPAYFSRLNKIIGDLELEKRVIFHGHVNDKAVLSQFYQRADIFVLPSLVEGFGIVLLDAMSYELPIIATNAGSIPELIKDGLNGSLVPPADPQALAKAINLLLHFPSLREQYGQTGHKFMVEHCKFYSWESVGNRVLQAMTPLLGNN